MLLCLFQELQYAQKYQAFPSKPSQINDLPVRDEPVLYSGKLLTHFFMLLLYFFHQKIKQGEIDHIN